MARKRKASRVLLTVQRPMTVLWPRERSRGLIRGGHGTNIWSDDPLLNTALIPEDVRRRMQIELSDQTRKCIPAPEGAEPTPVADDFARRVYDEVGYEVVPVDTTAASASRDAPVTRARERTEVTVPPVEGES